MTLKKLKNCKTFLRREEVTSSTFSNLGAGGLGQGERVPGQLTWLLFTLEVRECIGFIPVRFLAESKGK